MALTPETTLLSRHIALYPMEVVPVRMQWTEEQPECAPVSNISNTEAPPRSSPLLRSQQHLDGTIQIHIKTKAQNLSSSQPSSIGVVGIFRTTLYHVSASRVVPLVQPNMSETLHQSTLPPLRPRPDDDIRGLNPVIDQSVCQSGRSAPEHATYTSHRHSPSPRPHTPSH
jgi:hypothetical protein